MRVVSQVAGITAEDIRRMLSGLPDARGYRVVAKPLRFRSRPHLAAWTDFDAREIVLQIPDPFVPFGEVVPYAAKRRPGKGLRFIWLSEGVTFRTPREVVRFLFLHEWMHWYLKEVLGRKSAAETACDRFALANYRRRQVVAAAADEALRRPRLTGLPASPPQV
jgi:hypothetical protein